MADWWTTLVGAGAAIAVLAPLYHGVIRPWHLRWGIIDDEAVREAGFQEIVRRYFRYACEHSMGLVDRESVERIELLMEEHGLDTSKYLS